MSDVSSIRPGSLSAWILASRPRTLPVGVGPILVGGSLAATAGVGFDSVAFAAAILCAVLLQIGSNLANDVFDYEKGTDREDRIGPVRAAASGLLTPRQLKIGMAGVFAMAALFGGYLIFTGGWLIAVLGALAIISAIAYTAGPYPLGYNGLGDLFVLFFFGPVAVCGTEWVCGGGTSYDSLFLSLGPGLLAANVLAVNNLRDEESDRRSGKKTLVVRFGRTAGLVQYVGSVWMALCIPAALAIAFNLYFLLLPILAAPLAIINIRQLMSHRDGLTLNRVLARTAMLTLIYCVLLAIGAGL